MKWGGLVAFVNMVKFWHIQDKLLEGGKRLKIADTVVELINNNEYLEYLPLSEEDEVIIVPKLDEEFCHNVLILAGKEPSKG